MIKANELRIGNLVETDNLEGNIKTVVEIKHKMASVKYIRTDTNEPHQSMVDHERLTPIPVTEEWFLSFGFARITTNEYWFVIPLKDRSLAVSTYGNVEISSWDRLCIAHGLICKYVHQLQNLYFALTGEELKYNPT
jgi:hypothetical protein